MTERMCGIKCTKHYSLFKNTPVDWAALNNKDSLAVLFYSSTGKNPINFHCGGFHYYAKYQDLPWQVYYKLPEHDMTVSAHDAHAHTGFLISNLF